MSRGIVLEFGKTGGGVAERYGQVRLKSGLTRRSFAESLGIHPVVSGDIELGKRDPSREVLVRLADVYGVDINWLLTGRAAGIGSSYVVDSGSPALVHVALYDQDAAAGPGAEAYQDVPSFLLPIPASLIAPHRPSQVRAVSVRGDSMSGIGLADRDIVLFCPSDREGDGIFVLSVGSTVLVKRLAHDPLHGTLRLISENPLYPERLISGDELEQVHLAGRVIGWLHRHG